jgi:hypothetical protein
MFAFILDNLLGDANMKNYFIPLAAAAAYLAMTTVHAADPRVLIPPNRYRATLLAVSQHPAASTLETAAAPDAAAFNAHIVLWRSFDVPAAVNGTQPASINDLGEVTGVYFDTNGNQHGFLRKAGGKIVTFACRVRHQ